MGHWLVYIVRDDRKDIITLPIEAAEVRIEEGGVLAFYGDRKPGEREQLIQAFVPGRYLEVIEQGAKTRLRDHQKPLTHNPRMPVIAQHFKPRAQGWQEET